MATPHVSRAMRIRGSCTIEPMLPFLFPSLRTGGPQTHASAHQFSTSTSSSYPRGTRPKDNNKLRGMTALRSSGLNGKTLSVQKDLKGGILPVPVEPKKAKYLEYEVNKSHPLWAFFNRKKTFSATPDEDHRHGRAWAAEQLRVKSWDDLHAIWWMCVKEINRLSTEKHERSRLKLQYGSMEASIRVATVKHTMQNIKQVMLERHHAWTEARGMVQKDPTLTKRNIFEEEEVDEYEYFKDPELESQEPTESEHLQKDTIAATESPESQRQRV